MRITRACNAIQICLLIALGCCPLQAATLLEDEHPMIREYPYADCDDTVLCDYPCTAPVGVDPYIGCESDPYGFFFRQCTGYVAWRVNLDAGYVPTAPCGANVAEDVTAPFRNWMYNDEVPGRFGGAHNWDIRAQQLEQSGKPIKVNDVPAIGSIAQWKSIGHVAYVEDVLPDGIVVSEYNRGCDHSPRVRKYPQDGAWPDNFIHINRPAQVVSGATGICLSETTVNLIDQNGNNLTQITRGLGAYVVPISFCGTIKGVFSHVGYKPLTKFWFLSCDDLEKSSFSYGSDPTLMAELISTRLCSGPPSTRFAAGDRVAVEGTDGFGLRARRQPTLSSDYGNVMEVMSEGSQGLIVGGPICESGYQFWQIQYDAFPTVSLWSAEGEPETGEFFLDKKSASLVTVSGKATSNGNGLPGVQMFGLPGEPLTNSSGNYSAQVPKGWTGAIAPLKVGYSFSPQWYTYANLQTNKTNQNFSATSTQSTEVTINGYITLGSGSMNAPVKLKVTPSVPGSPFTVTEEFHIPVPSGWKGEIEPEASGYSFYPVKHLYYEDPVTKNLYSQNFKASVIIPETRLTANISPAEAISDGAGWLVSGPDRFDTGFRSSGSSILVTSYTTNNDYIEVTFKDLDSNKWISPSPQIVQEQIGQSKTITGTYIKKLGNLSVTISPQAARDAGAQWRVNGGTWRNSGFVEQGLAVGEYQIEFKDLNGWTEPSSRTVFAAYGETTQLGVSYINDGFGPTIHEISPTSGPIEGGTEVTIRGANFNQDAEVFFDGVAATGVQLVDATALKAIAPPRATLGSVDVEISQVNGTSVLENGFTYLAGVGQNLTLVGQIGGQTGAIKVVGNYAYLGEGPNFVILDVSNVSAPARVGKLLLEDEVRGISISGNHAFVACKSKGVYILDITNKSAPSLLGLYDTPGEARQVEELGGLLYVADGQSGLEILDVAQPEVPELLGSRSLPDSAEGIAILANQNGVYALIACAEAGLQVVDVSDPSLPSIVGDVDTPGSAVQIDLVGTLAYVADKTLPGGVSTGLRVIDVSDPTQPDEIGHRDNLIAIDVRVAGNRAYMLSSGIVVLDISNPSNIFTVTSNSNIGQASSLDVSGGHIFLANNDKGLRIFSADAPETVQGQFPASIAVANSVVTAADIAYVGLMQGGLRVISVSDPAALEQIGALSDNANIVDISLLGNYLNLSRSSEGINVLDISAPQSPQLRGQSSGIFAMDTHVSNGIVYAVGIDGSSFNNVLRIISIVNPNSPSVLGTFDFGTSSSDSKPEAVAVSGSFAYIAFGNDGLRVIDVSDAGNPQNRGSLNLAGYAHSIDIDGARCYLACEGPDSNSGSFLVVNVSDPDMPIHERSVTIPTIGNFIAIENDLAYVACGSAGVQVFDVSNTSADPVLVANYDTSGSARDISIADGLIHLADGNGGLVLLRLRDFSVPTVTITNPTANSDYETGIASVNLGGSAADAQGVTEVRWANHRGGIGTANGTTSWSASNISLQPGANIITVSALDAGGNAGSDTITVTYNAPPDTQVPIVEITGPTSGSEFTSDQGIITLSGLASDDRELSQVIWNSDRGAYGAATGSGSWTIPDIPLQDGTNIITVTARDTSDNEGQDSLIVHYAAPDMVHPLVQSVVRLDDSPTNADTVRYEVTFSENVVGVDITDFSCETDLGIVTATVTGVTGSGNSRTVEVSTGSGNGWIRLDVNQSGTLIVDSAGNALAGGFDTAETYVIDKDIPTVAVTSPTAELTRSGPVQFTVAYAGADNVSLSPASVALLKTGSVTASVSVDGAGASNRTVTLSNIAGNGSVQILIAAGTATDATGNVALSSGLSEPVLVVDNARPLVNLSSAAPETTNLSPIQVLAEFSETVTGFGPASLDTVNCDVGDFQANGKTYSFTLVPRDQGSVSVAVSPNIASDAAGNLNVGSNTLIRMYDSVAPNIILSTTAGASVGGSIDIDVSISEETQGFDLSDIKVENAWISGFKGAKSNYRFTLHPILDGVFAAQVRAGATSDTAGNKSKRSNELSRNFTEIMSLEQPNGTEQWPIDSARKIRWIGSLNADENVRIELWKDDEWVANVKKSTSNDGKFKWRIKAGKFEPGEGYRIRVINLDSENVIDDFSDEAFAIVDSKVENLK